jgi:hypothetical protein
MTPINIYFWWSGRDTIGLLFFAVFLFLLWRAKQNRPLYATMFMLSLAMELYGTALGSWRWLPEVPGLPFSSLNPPLCAGVFYCLLDALVVWSAEGLAQVNRSSILFKAFSLFSRSSSTIKSRVLSAKR